MTEAAAGNLRVAKPVEQVGSLGAIPLAEVVKKLSDDGKSGDLQIISGRTIKTVYFDRGFIVFSASNLKADRLGESLIEFGRISRHEFAMASMLMKTSRRKFGQVLVDSGLMSEEELGRQVGLQVNKIILSLFKETDGIYSFDERPCIIPMNLMVSLSVYRILLEGIRRMSSGKLILAGLPPLDTVLRVSEQPPWSFEFDKLKPVEQAVLRAAGKGEPLSVITKRVDSDRGRVLRACYGLYSAGVLERVDARASARPRKVQEETGVFLLSDIARKFAQIRASNIRQEVLMEFDKLDRVAEAELLKVTTGASRGELDKALAARREEWEKKRRLIENERSLVMKVDEIQARLTAAHEKLLAQRAAAAAKPEKPKPSERRRPAAAWAADPDTQPEAAKSAPPAAPPLPVVEDEFPEELSVLTLSQPGTAPPAAAAPPPPSEPAEPAEAEPTEVEEVAEWMRPRTSELSGAQRDEKTRQLLRDIQLHFQVRDYEGAISLLYELIALWPDNSAYHAMLAKAMMKHPVMSKNAERHFVEALRLDPQNADLHYSLGVYYKAFGLHSRAITEFRTAVRIDPRHEKARKQLSSEGKKDSIRDMFRKIFG
jgi:tetratricopeptide (TPR) repeat protein